MLCQLPLSRCCACWCCRLPGLFLAAPGAHPLPATLASTPRRPFRNLSCRARVEEFINATDVRVLTYYGDALTSVWGLPKKMPRGAWAIACGATRCDGLARECTMRLPPCS